MIILEKIALIVLILFLYLRRPIELLLKNRKINQLLDIYNQFLKAKTQDEKIKIFKQIAQNRPLSDDLIGNLYFLSPSYDDFWDVDKIKNTYFQLLEAFDYNLHWAKKYLHPKYVVKDFFYLPASLFSFLLNHKFKEVSSFLLSCFTWIATILISAYATEIRFFIEALVEKLTEIV